MQDGPEDLKSVWEFTPPGDLGSSGAWTVVRELALTLSRRGAWAASWKAEQGVSYHAGLGAVAEQAHITQIYLCTPCHLKCKAGSHAELAMPCMTLTDGCAVHASMRWGPDLACQRAAVYRHAQPCLNDVSSYAPPPS